MQSAYQFQWKFIHLLSALILIGAMAGGGVGATLQAYLQIQGVSGESEAFPGAIDIQSYSWGVSQTGSFSSGGGGGTGKVSIQDFHFTKYCDKSSPSLMDRCCSGTHFPTVKLVIVRQSDPPSDGTPASTQYLTYTLEDCLISSFSIGGSSSGEPVPVEEFSLNFTKIEFKYQSQRPGAIPIEAISQCLAQTPTK
jgi:type VI secretion system secreted protein Hcp